MKTKSIFAGLLMAATSVMNAQSWQLVGDQIDVNGSSVQSIAISKNNNMIYSAGNLLYGALPNNQVFKWDFTEWAPLGDVGIGASDGQNNVIRKIVLDNTDKAYIIGSFKDATGKYYVRYWNGSAWGPLGNLKSTQEFREMITDGTNIYVAGNFVNTNTGETCYISKWDGTSWSVVPQSNFNGVVHGMDFDEQNNMLVVGEMKNALNFYGVFKISTSGTVSEIGKVRSSSILYKVFSNKNSGQVIADTRGSGVFMYNPSTNVWTQAAMGAGYIALDYDRSGFFLSRYRNTNEYSWMTAWNTNTNTEVSLSNNLFAIDMKFDKFGYAICSSFNKVYRWSQKIGAGLATTETSSKSKITIYPNPSAGIVNISNKEKLSSVEVYDATGKLVQKAQPNADKTQIDLSGSKGVYMIKATSASGTDSQKVIIK